MPLGVFLKTSLRKDLFDSLGIFGKYFIRFLVFLEMGMDFSKRSSNGLLWKAFLEKIYRLLEKDLLGEKKFNTASSMGFFTKNKKENICLEMKSHEFWGKIIIRK